MSLLNDDTWPAGPYCVSVWETIEHDYDDSWDECDGTCVHSKIDELMWDDGPTRPGPEDDGIGSPYTWELFGFDSVDALMSWFDSDIYWLERAGYVLAVYEASKTRHGQCQSVFDWDSAERLTDYSLTNRVEIALDSQPGLW